MKISKLDYVILDTWEIEILINFKIFKTFFVNKDLLLNATAAAEFCSRVVLKRF